MTGSTITALAANPAPSPEISTFSSTVSTTAASATAAYPTRNAWNSNFSSIVRHLSSNYSFLFVSRFSFTQKYSVLIPLPAGERAG